MGTNPIITGTPLLASSSVIDFEQTGGSAAFAQGQFWQLLGSTDSPPFRCNGFYDYVRKQYRSIYVTTGRLSHSRRGRSATQQHATSGGTSTVRGRSRRGRNARAS